MAEVIQGVRVCSQVSDLHARNALAIAQLKATSLVTTANTSLANAIAIGDPTEIANAQARQSFLQHLADVITGQQAEQDMSNARLIAEAHADAIHTPALVQQQNAIAMGANELFAADVALRAGQLNVANVTAGAQLKGVAVLATTQAKLRNAQTRAGLK